MRRYFLTLDGDRHRLTTGPHGLGQVDVTPTSGIPAAPYPLRQVFPETLYWAPEARTGEDGRRLVELPLAGTLTTWRLTALASTTSGDLGAATYDLVVVQEFFVDATLPPSVAVGRALTATVTLYSYLPAAQPVRLHLAPAEGITVLEPPGALTVESGAVVSTTFVIRPDRSGVHTLRLSAEGPRASDAVEVPLVVP